MYKIPVYKKSRLIINNAIEGETIEKKVRRITHNKEPIKDGAPEIFSERKDGVIAAYNIRTDRWELATDAMDAIARSRIAHRDARLNPKEEEPKANLQIIKDEVGGPKPIQGEKGA